VQAQTKSAREKLAEFHELREQDARRRVLAIKAN
jgi:hypothetical protein